MRFKEPDKGRIKSDFEKQCMLKLAHSREGLNALAEYLSRDNYKIAKQFLKANNLKMIRRIHQDFQSQEALPVYRAPSEILRLLRKETYEQFQNTVAMSISKVKDKLLAQKRVAAERRGILKDLDVFIEQVTKEINGLNAKIAAIQKKKEYVLDKLYHARTSDEWDVQNYKGEDLTIEVNSLIEIRRQKTVELRAFMKLKESPQTEEDFKQFFAEK